MKYCTQCGHELIDEAVVCTKCGCNVNICHTVKTVVPEKDEADTGLIILSVIIPIIGLVLWALKNKETPNAAKAYGTAALIACGVWVAIYVLAVIFVSSAVSGFLRSI